MTAPTNNQVGRMVRLEEMIDESKRWDGDDPDAVEARRQWQAELDKLKEEMRR